jgi:hypothetical protein
MREALPALGKGLSTCIVVVLTETDREEEIHKLVTESYRILAPEKLIALLD